MFKTLKLLNKVSILIKVLLGIKVRKEFEFQVLRLSTL